MSVNQFSLQRLQPMHIDSVLALANAVGWGLKRTRVQAFLEHSTGFGHWLDGQLVSSTLHFRYGKSLSFVGLVIVHPKWQRRGLAKAVMETCLAADAGGVLPAALVATDAGFPMYQKLGFKTVRHLHRFIGTAQPNLLDKMCAKGHTARFRSQDMADVLAYDLDVLGANRGPLYQGVLESLTDIRLYRGADNRLRGVGGSTKFGQDLLVVGPLMADSEEIAMMLLRDLIGSWKGPVRIDVPDVQTGLITQVKNLGIECVHISPVMLRGSDKLPGDEGRLFGIMDAAIG